MKTFLQKNDVRHYGKYRCLPIEWLL
jgi:hypothetical protein